MALPDDEPVRAIRRRKAHLITVVTAKSVMHATDKTGLTAAVRPGMRFLFLHFSKYAECAQYAKYATCYLACVGHLCAPVNYTSLNIMSYQQFRLPRA